MSSETPGAKPPEREVVVGDTRANTSGANGLERPMSVCPCFNMRR